MPTVDFSTNTVDYGSFCSLTVTLTMSNTVLPLGSVTFPYTFDPTSHGLDEHDIDGTYVFDCNGCEFTRVVEYTPPPQTAVYRMNLCCEDGYEGNPTTYSLIELPNTYSTGDVISIYGVCYTVDTEFNAIPEITPNTEDIFPFSACSKCLNNVNTINCNNTTTSTTTESTGCQSTCTAYRVYYTPQGLGTVQNSFSYIDCEGNEQSVNNLQAYNNSDYEEICVCGTFNLYVGYEDYSFTTMNNGGCYHLGDQ